MAIDSYAARILADNLAEGASLEAPELALLAGASLTSVYLAACERHAVMVDDDAAAPVSGVAPTMAARARLDR